MCNVIVLLGDMHFMISFLCRLVKRLLTYSPVI